MGTWPRTVCTPRLVKATMQDMRREQGMRKGKMGSCCRNLGGGGDRKDNAEGMLGLIGDRENDPEVIWGRGGVEMMMILWGYEWGYKGSC